MIKKLYPTASLTSIYELNIENLKEEGIKGIIFDIDNTLVPYDVPEPNERIIHFFETLQSEGFKITLLSNNKEDRVMKFNEKLKVLAFHQARKPLTKHLRKALTIMNCMPEETVLVGDQIFTDIYVGNLTGVKTFLVQPISDKDEWQTKIKRGLEKKVIQSYQRYLKKNC